MPTITGTDNDNTMDLSLAENNLKINLGDGNDILISGSGNDRINAGDGDDIITGGEGDDVIYGNDGFDTSVYTNSVFDYLNSDRELNLVEGKGNALVFDTLGNEGVDTLKHIEALQFNDATFYTDGRNNGPVARDSLASTDEDNAITIDIANEIVDLDGDTLTIDSAVSSSGAIVTINNDYTLSYNPNELFEYLAVGESLVDTITYVISDGNGGTATAEVAVTIIGTNDAPILTVANMLATEDGPAITGTASFTDVDTSDTHVYSVTAMAATEGTVSIDSITGEYTYTVGSDFQALAAGETTTVSFNITVTDNNGASDTKTVSVVVTGTNDQPIVSDVSESATETNGIEEIFAGQLALTTDLDTTDLHTFAQDGTAAVVTNSAAVVTDLVVDVQLDGSYTIDGNFDALADGEIATVTFDYVAIDDSGTGTNTSVPQTVTLTVTGTNDAPIAEADTDAVLENQTVTIDVLNNDTDIDNGAVFTLDTIDSITNGTVTIVDNKLVFQADAVSFDNLAQGVEETVTVNYTMSDENGAPSSSTVTITVTGTNDRPVVENVNMIEDTSFTMTYESSFAGFNNSYGYYLKDSSGNPTTGVVVWDNVKDGDAPVTVTGYSQDEVGFFIIPHGDGLNIGLEDNTPVTFALTDGLWQAESPTGLLEGYGTPVIFDNASLNSSGQDQVIDNSYAGNQNWEDLSTSGGSYDDVNIDVQWTSNPAAGSYETTDASEVTTFTGSLATAIDLDTTDTHQYFIDGTVVVDNSILDIANINVSVTTAGEYTVEGNFEALATGETATVTFNYVAKDNSGADNDTSDAKQVSVTITGTDDAVVVSGVDTIITTEEVDIPEEDLSSFARHETVGGEVFLGGEFIELGIHNSGSFGTSGSAPTNFFGTDGSSRIGLSSDADGFDQGLDLAIDYFLPGTPAESWSIGYKTNTSTITATNAGLVGHNGISNFTNTDTSDGNTLSSYGTGSLNDTLQTDVNVSFNASDDFFMTTVTLTNLGLVNIDDVRYMRSFDPDNTQYKGGSYTTINTVENTFEAGDGSALVSATSLAGDAYHTLSGEQAKIFFYSEDASAKATTTGGLYETNVYAADVYDDTLDKGTSVTRDQGISIAFDVGTLAPGESTTVTYYTALTNRDIDTVVDNIVESSTETVTLFDVDGGSIDLDTLITSVQTTSLDKIELTGKVELNIDISDVLDITDGSHELIISGDSDDVIHLDSTFNMGIDNNDGTHIYTGSDGIDTVLITIDNAITVD